ncbi:hypothetical protein CC86DRAFT_411911 [Ophiobolus disseminans]|uniref:SprT-like domain-containing protein n=1 Tax=Ophiobolus disseminans TaxID=1469910 RepID=A0A6A6ZK32_9PLEO|nr:hypothetical protein CC86DRAFT_411911 [Ophiobolus disseminans]
MNVPGQDPGPMISKSGQQSRFEALHLVDETIVFFSRSREDMSRSRLDAPSEFHALKNGLVEALNQGDCSEIPTRDMRNAIRLLGRVFFMGAIGQDVIFDWERDIGRLEEGILGSTHSYKESGRIRHRIYMNPSHTKVRTHMLASARVGTLLHEILHAFLYEFACADCITAPDNIGGKGIQNHGRAWHRLAQALDQYAPKLLELPDIDLSRLVTLRNWVERSQEARAEGAGPNDGRVWKPSIHDLHNLGFV